MHGEFSAPLVIEYIDGPVPFKLRKGFSYTLHQRKMGSIRLDAAESMVFDGTSMPPGTRWLISKSDPELMQCAAGHDAGFRHARLVFVVGGRTTRRKATRAQINMMMAAMMKTKKVAFWKRAVINTGLAVGSRGPWRKCRRLYD